MSDLEKQLSEQILYHKRKYYDGEPEISDAEYDLLEKQLREINPDHPVLYLVGTPDNGKILHDPPMLSCDKAYTIDEVVKWMDKIEGRSLYAGYKVDGLSLSLIYEHGKFVQAATRGNGVAGDDVTLSVMLIEEIPKTIPSSDRMNIRGEVYMRISEFKKTNSKLPKEDKYASPRNLAVGTLRHKNIDIHENRKLSFKAFDLIGIGKKLSIDEIVTTLKLWSFDVADIQLIENSTKEKVRIVFEEFEKERDELDFEIDGVIFKYNEFEDREKAGSTEHHPKWQIAWKFQSKSEQTTILGITWQVGRTGVLTPVAEIEPTDIAGATIRRATLHNADFVQNMNVAIGDNVTVVRAGDVIPKIIGIVTKGPDDFSFPTSCPSCQSKLLREGVNLICNNDQCRDRDIQAILHWIKIVELDGFASKGIENLYDLGLVKNYADLYSPKLTIDLLKHHFGKNGVKFYYNIQNGKEIPFDKFIAGLGIPTLGKKMGKTLADKFSTFEELKSADLADLILIEGISDITANYIINGLQDPKYTQGLFENGVTITYGKKRSVVRKPVSTGGLADFWDDFEEDQDGKEENSENIGNGRKIYVTGSVKDYTKKQLIEYLEGLGFQWSSSISTKLDILVYGEKPGAKKLEKAKKIGVLVKSWDEFTAELPK